MVLDIQPGCIALILLGSTADSDSASLGSNLAPPPLQIRFRLGLGGVRIRGVSRLSGLTPVLVRGSPPGSRDLHGTIRKGTLLRDPKNLLSVSQRHFDLR
jgi:hypothetical protein